MRRRQGLSLPDVGFGIVGAGVAARFHARAIANTAGAQLVATCRSNPASVEATTKQFGVPCLTDYAQLLSRSDVDAVCVCTPSGLHAQQTIVAARAGKHVLVEKPMALTLDEADRMTSACHRARVQLGVAFQRRMEPSAEAVRAAIGAEELGRLVLGQAIVPYFRDETYFKAAPWRGTWALDGGGALMNQGIHLADLLLWFMGDVEEVNARVATLAHPIEVEDCVAATLRFASGALGSITATTAASPGFPHSIQIYGTKAGVHLEDDNIVRWESGGGAPRSTAVPARPSAGAGASPTAITATGHTRIISDFVDAVRQHRAPAIPGEEGRRALALVLAVYEAARSGKPAKPR